MAIDFTALNNACVLYYSMDNADVSGSTILDLTPNNNDGTINGATTGVTGRLNQALSLDADGEYVSDSSVFGSLVGSGNTMTLNMWIYPTDSSDSRVIAALYPSTESNKVFVFRTNTDNTIYVYSRSTGSVFSDANLLFNQWNMVTWIWDSSTDTTSFYINGVFSGSGSQTFNSYTGTGYFGRLESNNNGFRGKIDEVSMFNKAITLEEHQFFYNQGAPTVNQQYPFSPNVIYEIKGEVTLSGTATQGATLRLYDQTEGTYEGSTTTDVSGNYLFENLTDGNEYHVSVEYNDGTTKYNDESKPYVTPTEQ